MKISESKTTNILSIKVHMSGFSCPYFSFGCMTIQSPFGFLYNDRYFILLSRVGGYLSLDSAVTLLSFSKSHKDCHVKVKATLLKMKLYQYLFYFALVLNDERRD